MRFPRKNRRPGVVASVEQQTAAAAALAQIAGQRRLADPRTNPAVRSLADQLRDDQHRRALDAEHSRLVRRHRVEDRRAEHAEKTLEAILQARQTSSPARSVMALHSGRKRYMGVTLAASLALSVGSAIGLAHLAHTLGAPEAVGYIAEVGLTGLTTTTIMYRSHLTEHGGQAEGWQAKTLWILMVLPLLATVVANAISNGPVGVFCSIGAASFALLSAVISDRSTATMRDRADEVTTDDEADLRSVAMGDDLFTAVEADETEPTEAEHDAARVDALFSDAALATWLNKPPEDGVTALARTPDADGPQGATQDTSRPDQISGDQRDEPTDEDRLKAVQARKTRGEQTRARIADHMTAHPDHTIEQIAAALGVSAATVKRHRRAIQSD